MIQKIKPSIKKDWIDSNTDLIENGLLDSFEMLELILLLEKKCNFNYDNYVKKHNNFKVKNLETYLNIQLF
tara:strand:- start:40 stop:252 length:213 start_codon:yes stop_codon:yes gene_type:complete